MSRTLHEPSAPPGEHRPGLRGLLHALFSGAEQDFTKGSLRRAIALLAVPMVLEMLMQSVFEVADVFFVGRLGAEAVAVVGLSGTLLVLVFTVAMGLGMGAMAVVARRIGEGDPGGASRAAAQALWLGVVVSIPPAVLGVAFAPEMLALMGATPEVVALGTPYLSILFGTNAVVMLLFLINAIFRGAGDAAQAMQALWLANLLNIVLDPLLIFGVGPFPELGVTGAAVATVIGRGVGVAFQLRILFFGRSRLRLGRSVLRVHPEGMRRIVRLSLPAMLQYFIGTASWMVVFRLVSLFGTDAQAGYTIAIRILIFALLPSWGMGSAAATLVGQNLGAQQPERAERSVWMTSFANMIFLGLVSVLTILQAEALVRFFTDDPGVVAFGAESLRIISFSYIPFAFGMVVVQAFNGAGDTTTPTWINFVCHWCLQIPLAWVLAQPFEMEATGVFVAVTVAQAALAVVSVAVFRRGHWKLKTV